MYIYIYIYELVNGGWKVSNQQIKLWAHLGQGFICQKMKAEEKC